MRNRRTSAFSTWAWIRLILVGGAAILYGASARQCLAWGDEGHRIVAGLAAQGLNSETRGWVRELLGADEGQEARRMEQVSSWADDVRGWHKNWADARRSRPNVELADASVPVPVALRGNAGERALARAYILNLVDSLPGNGDRVRAALDQQSNFHFTNLPHGSTSYPSARVGKGPNDCVNAILRCVRVLKGDSQSGDVMNRQQALRFLIHLVGDLHQPLHAGVGYWKPAGDGDDTATMCTPQEAPAGVNDLGGNSLKFEGDDPVPDFHKLWDGEMVRRSREKHREAESDTYAQVAARYREHLMTLINDPEPWGLSGSIRSNVQRWDISSVRWSARAYSPLLTDRLKVKRVGSRLRLSGFVQMPPSYLEENRSIVNRQLAAGGYHLAAILNAI